MLKNHSVYHSSIAVHYDYISIFFFCSVNVQTNIVPKEHERENSVLTNTRQMSQRYFVSSEQKKLKNTTYKYHSGFIDRVFSSKGYLIYLVRTRVCHCQEEDSYTRVVFVSMRPQVSFSGHGFIFIFSPETAVVCPSHTHTRARLFNNT